MLILQIQNNAKTLKNHQNPGKWVLIWKYSVRAFQWVPTWQGLDGFQRFLRSCALGECSLSIGRVNVGFQIAMIFFIHGWINRNKPTDWWGNQNHSKIYVGTYHRKCLDIVRPKSQTQSVTIHFPKYKTANYATKHEARDIDNLLSHWN